MKPRRKIPVHVAATEAMEVRSWTCETCNLMVDDGERYCRHCGPYWEDVKNGLWEDDY